MTTVSSRELKEHYGAYRIRAHKEPVFITNYGKDDLVLLSIEEYHRLRKSEQRAFHASEMPEELLSSLERLDIPEEAKHYNDEVR